MKKLVWFLFFVISGVSFASSNNYLFFQTASKAKIVKVKDEQYVLTIKNADDYVSYFSDRPKRQAGSISLKEFINMWSNKTIKNNFAVSPPNAAIIVVTKAGERKKVVVEVTNPILQKNRLSYDLKAIEAHPLPTGELKHVTLFFDDISWNPGGF